MAVKKQERGTATRFSWRFASDVDLGDWQNPAGLADKNSIQLMGPTISRYRILSKLGGGGLGGGVQGLGYAAAPIRGAEHGGAVLRGQFCRYSMWVACLQHHPRAQLHAMALEREKVLATMDDPEPHSVQAMMLVYCGEKEVGMRMLEKCSTRRFFARTRQFGRTRCSRI